VRCKLYENIAKTRVVSYWRKTNDLSHEYQLWYSVIVRTSSIKDLDFLFDSKLRFQNHVDFMFSECIKLLGLRDRKIFFLGLFVYKLLCVGQVQVGTCLGSSVFCHNCRCQQSRAHPVEVCFRLFLSCFTHVLYSLIFAL
jgi:hypothetical protein